MARIMPRGIYPRPSIEQRIWSKVEKTASCWNWNGSKLRGYGLFRVHSPQSMTYAHRFVYESIVGPIPEGLELDHLCRNPSCVNPDHLEAVPHKVNVLRG